LKFNQHQHYYNHLHQVLYTVNYCLQVNCLLVDRYSLL